MLHPGWEYRDQTETPESRLVVPVCGQVWYHAKLCIRPASLQCQCHVRPRFKIKTPTVLGYVKKRLMNLEKSKKKKKNSFNIKTWPHTGYE